MADLATVDDFRQALARLVGTDADDPAFERQDEEPGYVVDYALTVGSREAQRKMLDYGYVGWRSTQGPLTFAAARGGTKSVALEDDFLRAYGDDKRSALFTSDGRRWGQEIEPRDWQRAGNLYWIEGETLFIARNASPPTGLTLDYHYMHPEWEDEVEIDFPKEARHLIVSEGASFIMEENWLPGGEEMEAKIFRSLARDRRIAQGVARRTKQARRLRGPARFGLRW